MSVECSYCGSYREFRKRCDSCGAYEVTEADRRPAERVEFLGGYAPSQSAQFQYELLARQQSDLNGAAAALLAQQEYNAQAQQNAASGFGALGYGLGALLGVSWP